MSTHFMGEGNIGSDPEIRMFPANGNQPPRGVLRLNVRFDNLVSTDQGLVDKGGFWANVEIWHRDVEAWAKLYQRGMRVIVSGRMVLDEWKDRESGEDRSAFKVQAVRIGMLPYRLVQVTMMDQNDGSDRQQYAPGSQGGTSSQAAYPKSAGPDGEWVDPTGNSDVPMS